MVEAEGGAEGAVVIMMASAALEAVAASLDVKKAVLFRVLVILVMRSLATGPVRHAKPTFSHPRSSAIVASQPSQGTRRSLGTGPARRAK